MSSSTEISASSELADTVRIEADPVASRLPETVATITHELKTPLASILGYSRMLRAGWDSMEPAQREEFFGVIDQQGRALQRLIEDLLECTRLDAGPRRLRRDPLDLSAIVRDAIATVSGIAAGHRLAAHVPGHDLGVYGDPQAIEHVLTNLLENAVKYSPPGSGVEVVVVEAGQEVRVAVRDQGPGIATEDRPHVFRRFRRGVSGGRGVGLGLHIVSSLVGAHRGRVWVDSRPGEGATFTFALPRRTLR